MKITEGSIVDLKEAIRTDLLVRSQSEIDSRVASSLGGCAACSLAVRSANSYDWMTVFPRICSKKSKERAINRVLSSPLIDVAEVMFYYVAEVVKKLSKNGKTIILMIDQSQISENLQCLMVSVRFGERAIPILWTVEEKKGNIGFAITDTHVTKVDRLEKLILILTIALFWAVSVGMTPANPEEKKYSKKNFTDPCAPLLNEDCEL